MITLDTITELVTVAGWCVLLAILSDIGRKLRRLQARQSARAKLRRS